MARSYTDFLAGRRLPAHQQSSNPYLNYAAAAMGSPVDPNAWGGLPPGYTQAPVTAPGTIRDGPPKPNVLDDPLFGRLVASGMAPPEAARFMLSQSASAPPTPQTGPQPIANTGSPTFQLGGSSDQLMTVGSSGYDQLPVNPGIVAAASQPGATKPLPEGPSTNATTLASNPMGWIGGAIGSIPVVGQPILSGLDKFNQAQTASRLYVQDTEAEGMYHDMKNNRGKMSDRDLVLKFSGGLDLSVNGVGYGMTEAESTKFIDGLIAAYEHGYDAPGAQPPSIPGYPVAATAKRPVVAHFEPGARAAHEYIASTLNWYSRTAADVANDPFNVLLGPARGVGESLAEAGGRLVAKGAVEEGTAAALKTGVGRALQVTGKVAAVPDIVLNQAADNLIGGVAGVVKDIGTAIPGVGRVIEHLGATPIKVEGRIAREDFADAGHIANQIEKPRDLTGPIGGSEIGGSPLPETPVPPTDFPLGATMPDSLTTDIPGPPGVPEILHPAAAMDTTPPVYHPSKSPERTAGLKDGSVNVFDPTTDGVRLIDRAYQSSLAGDPIGVDRWNSFDALNKAKREAAFARDRTIQGQIGRMDDEINKLKLQRAGPYGNASNEALQAQIEVRFADREKLKFDQKINGVQHTVDVAHDYKNVYGELPPEIPHSAKRGSITHADGSVSKVPYTREPTDWLVERAVYASDDNALNVLAKRVEERTNYKKRLTQEQFDQVLNAQLDLKSIKETPGVSHETTVAGEHPAALMNDPVWKAYEDAIRKQSFSTSNQGITVREQKAYDASKELMKVAREKYGYSIEDSYKLIGDVRKPIWDQADALDSISAAAPVAPAAEPVPPGAPPVEPPVTGGTPPIPPKPEPPLELLPPDIKHKMDVETFTGAKEPLYTGKTFRQVRDQIQATFAVKQDRARALVMEIANDKKQLGLGDTQLLRPGESAASKKSRIVVTEQLGDRTATVKGKPRKLLTSTDVIAKEQELADLLVEHARYGDIVDGDLQTMATDAAAYQKELDVNPKAARRLPLAIDLIDVLANRLQRHLLIADPLTSYGYSERNIMGNVTTALLMSRDKPRVMEMIFQSLRKDIRTGKVPPMADRWAQDMGLVRASSQYERKGVVALEGHSIGAMTPTREFFKKLHLDAPARMFDWKRGVDAGFEYAAKVEMGFTPVAKHLTFEKMDQLATDMAAYAARPGRNLPFTKDELMDVFMGLRKEGTEAFSYDDVHDALYQMAKARGVDEAAAKRFAETAKQKWIRSGREAQLEAIAHTNRVYPSQRRMTNLDNYLKYITLFHFWATRTARNVLEEMIRNPQLYNIWKESHKGLARMAEEGNYPASVKMLMYVADSPFGFMLYANPASLFLITALQPDTPDAPDPQGMTWLGSQIKHFKNKTGLGPTPFIDAILNVTGVYGNAFPPNPWPSRTTELAGAAIDYGWIASGHGPGTPVYDNAMAQFRALVSGKLPGTSNVPMTDQQANTIDIVGSLVLDNNPTLAARMAQVNPDGSMTPDAIRAKAEFAAIMDNEDDPQYIKAAKDAAAQRLFTNTINAVSPFTIKAKIATREATIEVAHAGRDARAAKTLLTPMQEAAINIRSGVTQTPAANTLDAQVGQYHDIGTPRQQTLGQGWAMIAYGQFDSIILVEGQIYTAPQIKAMDKSLRYDLADRWVREVGGTAEYADYKAKQDAYVAAHPEMKGYDDYKTMVSHSGLGEDAWIAGTRKVNPNYDRYLTEQEQRYGKTARDAAFTPGAYFAYMGEQAKIYAPTPISTWDISNQPANADMFTGGSAAAYPPKDESVAGRAQSLSDDIIKYNADLAAVQPYLPKTVAWESMSPTQRQVYTENLKERGIDIPSMPQLIELYYRWVNTRKVGEGTSYEDFVRSMDEINNKTKVAA